VKYNNGKNLNPKAMKNSLNILLLSICLLAGITRAGAFPAIPDSLVCLELQGKIMNASDGLDGICKITILKMTGLPDTFILKKGHRKFRAYFQKNSSYTVTVSKDGYCSKTIMINTTLAEHNDKVYTFAFDAHLDPMNFDGSLIRQQNCTVAMIYFDKKKNCFYYNRINRSLASNLLSHQN
jgi:hypothetical protein